MMEPRPRFLPIERPNYSGGSYTPTSSDALIATLLALGDVLLASDPKEAVKTARLIVVNHLALLGYDYAHNSWMED